MFAITHLTDHVEVGGHLQQQQQQQQHYFCVRVQLAELRMAASPSSIYCW
jgi:hypothetical protein